MRFEVGWKLVVPVCATVEVPLETGNYFVSVPGGGEMRLLLVYGRKMPEAYEFERESTMCINKQFTVVGGKATLLVCRGSMFSTTRSVEIERRA